MKFDWRGNEKAAESASATLFMESTAQTQTLDELLVFLRLSIFEVVEMLASLVHELDEPAPRGMVAFVRIEVLGQPVDALREKRDLHFGRAGVLRAAPKLGEEPIFFLSR